MKRIWLLTMAVAMSAGGCSFLDSLNPLSTTRKPEKEVLSPVEWDRLKRENQARLAGEGIGSQPVVAQPPSVSRMIDDLADMMEFMFITFPERLIQYATGQTPARFARMMEDGNSADARREGILELASRYNFARVDPYTRRYWQIAQSDPDYLVRAAALRALNRSRYPKSGEVFVRSMDDRHMIVRLEAAKALANVPDKGSVPVLLRHLAGQIELRGETARPERVSESRDVRLACADALRNFAERDVARALVEVLKDREFEVSWQARQSLILLTGHDYRYDQDKWREYLNTGNPFG